MAIICSDGACKRNGKPDCTSAFAVVVMDNDGNVTETVSDGEHFSTSQRGELYGALCALVIGARIRLKNEDETIFFVTDSSYISRGINGKWYEKWQRNGWITSEGTEVKNRDIWEQIAAYLKMYPEDSLFVYLIKGHIKPDKIDEAIDKFKENNNGVVPPWDIFQSMIKGNNLADELAKEKVVEMEEVKA